MIRFFFSRNSTKYFMRSFSTKFLRNNSWDSFKNIKNFGDFLRNFSMGVPPKFFQGVFQKPFSKFLYKSYRVSPKILWKISSVISAQIPTRSVFRKYAYGSIRNVYQNVLRGPRRICSDIPSGVFRSFF